MNRSVVVAILLGMAVVALLLPPARAQKKDAEKKTVKLVKEWKGSIADDSLAKDAPECIADAKALKKLWEKWGLEDKVPEVDFKKEIVIISTTSGSQLTLSAKLDDKGNLEVIGAATNDFVAGFRYVIATVSRKGVKTVNGKELKEAAEDKD
jgi:hypothetical protein